MRKLLWQILILFDARTAGKLKTIDNYVSRSKAIKLMCTECMGWDAHPNGCTDINCPLYPFRGKTLMAYSSTSPDNEPEE